MAKLIVVEGSKGGVGKSIVASAVVDAVLTERRGTVWLVDADAANTDVGKAYNNVVPWSSPDLDCKAGFMDLIDTLAVAQESKISHVVVSCPARVGGWEAYGEMLTEAAGQLQIPVTVLWVLSRQRDSLEALNHFSKIMPTTTICPVINEFWGHTAQFERYNNSHTKVKVLERAGAVEIIFPDVADRVVDAMRDLRLSWNKLESLSFSCKIEAERFRRVAAAALAPVL